MNWYIQVLKKYAIFNGRAQRKEYWYFFLFHMIISMVLGIIDGFIDTFNHEVNIGLLSGIYIMLVLIPSIGVTVRRLHDIGKSGWWVLLSLIPLIGSIILLIFMIKDSEFGANIYGVNPKMA